MRVHANDGVSAQAKESLVEEGFKVTTDHVPQDRLQAYLNKEKVDVLLVRRCFPSQWLLDKLKFLRHSTP